MAEPAEAPALPRLSSQLWARWSRTLREHLPVLLVAPALIIATTWPTFYHVFETETFWIPNDGQDIWYELWEGWYGGEILQGRADLFYTDLLFYPHGTSLLYHQHTVPHMLYYSAMRLLLPISNAYNLGYLVTLFFNALAAYVCALYFLKDKWISLFAAGFIGICVTLRTKVDIQFWSYYTLPLSIYFMRRAVAEGRQKYAVLCGAAAGLTVYIGFYVLVCQLLTLGIYALALAWSRWKDIRFWKLALVAGLVFAVIGLPRIAPLLSDSEVVDAVLEFRPYWRSASNDLVDFFLHPVFLIIDYQPAYLGIVPLLLGLLGFAAHRLTLLPWLLIMIAFMTLRLGTYLTVYGYAYPDILLPKHYLNDLFPEFFRGLAGGHHWVLGALFPLAMLACYGLKTLLRGRSVRVRALVILPLLGLTALEHWQVPVPGRVIPDESLAFLDWLESEAEDEIVLIHLPMNVDFQRRYYNFLQMLSGYPQVEGSVNRVLPEAFEYIHGNLLLSAWKRGEAIHCLPHNRDAYLAAVDQLRADGFTHVVRNLPAVKREAFLSFISVPAAYQDKYAAITRVSDLEASCGNSGLRQFDQPPHLLEAALASQLQPDGETVLLSASRSGPLDDAVFTLYSTVFADWEAFVHVYPHDGALAIQHSNDRYAELGLISTETQRLLLLHEPGPDDWASLPGFADWLEREFRACGRALESSRAIAEITIESQFDCAILDTAGRQPVAYDNGLQVFFDWRLLVDALEIEFHWRSSPDGERGAAYSVQVFAADGLKAHQEDRVIDGNLLAKTQLQLDSLAPGEYAAKLIVYEYDTGVSIPGDEGANGGRFERELELVRFKVE